MPIYRREFTLGIIAGTAAKLLPALPLRPKLLVLVVLEQFRQDYWDSAEGQLRDNGLRRILLKGAHFPDCRNLASTFPMSSLATIATGAWPAEHGIVADSWCDPAAKGAVPASSESLLATTLMGQLAGDRQNRTYVIGMDAAQAGLFAAGSGARQFWMDGSGNFTTLGELPEWLVEFNRLNPVDNLHNSPWMAVGAKTGAPPMRTLTYD